MAIPARSYLIRSVGGRVALSYTLRAVMIAWFFLGRTIAHVAELNALHSAFSVEVCEWHSPKNFAGIVWTNTRCSEPY